MTVLSAPHRTLLDAPKGALVCVQEVSGPAGVVLALEEIGIHPGTQLRVLRRAPLGCPLVVALDGARFALRCDSARHVAILDAEAKA